MMRSNLNRRELLGRLGLAAAGAISCPMHTFAQKRQFINFWGTGTLDIGDWKAIETEKGIVVEFDDNGNDPGPVVQRLSGDGEAAWRHISGLQGGAEPVLAEKGAIEPWDITKINNFGKIWDFVLRKIPYIERNNEYYGIPTVINADSMIYLPDRAGLVDSYSFVFDPLLKGRTAMEDAWINSVIMTAIYLKETNQCIIREPANLTESELREVMGFLKEKGREGQFRKLWRSYVEATNMIVNGEVYVMTGWEPIAIQAQRRGAKAEYATPKEGYEGWSNNLLLHPGARKDGVWEAAHQLADWELGGYYGCAITMTSGYAVPTDEAVRYAEDYPGQFNPQEISERIARVKNKFLRMKGIQYWQNVMPDNKALYEEEWAEFRAIVNGSSNHKG
jgi:putative spermidine/putrescine transport system substrate-binding protein